MNNRQKEEFRGIISRGTGLLRLDHLSQLGDPYRLSALKLVDKFEADLYDIIDGKEAVEVLEPKEVVKKVSKKATKKASK